MYLDAAKLHVLWRETNTRIDVLQRRVNEGVDVDAASEFCRWLRFCGVMRILEEAPSDSVLPCPGKELAAKIESLGRDCYAWYAQHERANVKPPSQVPRSELEAINAQLQSLQAQLSSLAQAQVADSQGVALRVVGGSADFLPAKSA